MVALCDSAAPFFSVFVKWKEGTISRHDADATAFPHRNATLDISVLQRWSDPPQDEERIEWVQEFHETMAPFAAEGVDVNDLDQDEDDRVREAYGRRYERLRELKNEWVPPIYSA